VKNPFSVICDKIGGNLDDPEEQFETALCAYYAVNQEILSRVQFPGNDRKNCTIDKIFRLEGLDSLEELGIVKRKIVGKKTRRRVIYEADIDGVAANAFRAIIVSSSAGMFVNSLDKPASFPPPIKVITRYNDVHHARIFGCHLFNVDIGDAKRTLPDFFERKPHSRYEDGCPFFKDRQREFLMMPRGCGADVVGILPWAPNTSECYVWSKDECLTEDIGEITDFNTIKKDCLKKEISDVFAEELGLGDDLDSSSVIAAVQAAGQAVAGKIRDEGVGSVMPQKVLQINFANLSDAEIGRFLTFFNDMGGQDGELKSYRNQLEAIKATYEFDTLYDYSYDQM
jgi:hypothetical protein